MSITPNSLFLLQTGSISPIVGRVDQDNASQIQFLNRIIENAISSVTPREVGATSLTALPATSQDTFPCKLFRILSTPEFERIISWSPTGLCWKIHNVHQFTEIILPLVFGSTGSSGLASFARELQRYGFRQLTDGPERSFYYHQLFARDHPDACLCMRPVDGLTNTLFVKQAIEASKQSQLPPSSLIRLVKNDEPKATPPKKVSKRKKWLPSLGPSPILDKISASRRDWMHTSPEAFSLHSEMNYRK